MLSGCIVMLARERFSREMGAGMGHPGVYLIPYTTRYTDRVLY
jgi:hypothetical protein